MPNCRNCGTRLTKFEKDLCPICGCKNPLEGVSSETIEITSQIDGVSEKLKGFHQKSRSVCFLLSIFVGFSGAAYFYQYKILKGILWFFINLLIYGGLAAVFFFFAEIEWLSFLLPVTIVYAINIGMGFYFLYIRDYRDGRGNFLK